MRKNTPIRVGVLGLGRSGWDIHVAALRDDPRFTIAGVMDGLEDRLRQAREELHCSVFKRADDLLHSLRADLIINALPTPFHAPLSKEALNSGFHVVLEKPVACNAAEARSVYRVAKANRKKLFFHHNYRFMPVFRHFCEVIDSGILGEVFEIKVNITGFTRRNDWQTLRRNHGGLLNNHGTHYIDWVMQLMGAPVKDVFSDLKQISDSGNVDDHARVILRARNGCLADFHLSTSTAADLPRYLILGTCGTLSSDGQQSTLRYFDPKRVKALPVDTRPPAKRAYGNEDKLPWRGKTMKAVTRDKSGFYDNTFDVLRRRKAMAVTPESVIDTLKVMDRVRSPISSWRPAFTA